MAHNVSSPVRSSMDSPASSVRQSLDVPRLSNRKASPSPSPHPQTQRRNRAALRDYYNLQGTNGAAPHVPSRTASSASTTSTVTNAAPTASTAPTPQNDVLPLIDSPEFDPDSYVTSLMSTSSLSSILRAESILVSEIKNLDGERKALVYDNYNKLIRATETIGQLQKGMGDHEGGGLKAMESLLPAMDKVAQTANEIQAIRQASSGRRG